MGLNDRVAIGHARESRKAQKLVASYEIITFLSSKYLEHLLSRRV